MNDFVISTPRLDLRPFLPEDAEAFYHMNLDKEVMRYTGDEAFSSPIEARIFIENYDAYLKWGYGRWAVVEKSSTDFIGFCGFKINEENLVDLGFRFIRSRWNQGYATEAADACLNYGFEVLDMKEIVGRADRSNLASIRVLEKIGMSYWKLGSCGGIPNAAYFRISRDDFSKIKDK